VRGLRAITKAHGTISGGPDFAYRMCVDRIRDDQLEGLDLSSWRLAFTGAEPVSAATLGAFGERFGPVGFQPSAFYPCYGLAESTLFVTGGAAGAGPTITPLSRRGLGAGVAAPPEDPDDERVLVSNGAVIGERTEVVIVDPTSGELCAAGAVGEIWVQGPSVASGYFGQPDLTATTFEARTADGAGPYLRTGDLGCLVDRQLHVTGRLKDTIVVEGRTLDAHDVEDAIRQAIHADRQGLTAALSVTDAGHERMVVVQEVGRLASAGAPELMRDIQAAVAERFGARPDEVVLVPIGALPRTTSGKLRRAEAARQVVAGELRRLAPPSALTTAAGDAG
jgi:acyl-CoA synthetase (AMP-forming)/AMP-acid ligase II